MHPTNILKTIIQSILVNWKCNLFYPWWLWEFSFNIWMHKCPLQLLHTDLKIEGKSISMLSSIHWDHCFAVMNYTKSWHAFTRSIKTSCSKHVSEKIDVKYFCLLIVWMLLRCFCLNFQLQGHFCYFFDEKGFPPHVYLILSLCCCL